MLRRRRPPLSCPPSRPPHPCSPPGACEAGGCDPAAGAAAPPALTVVGYGADFVRPGSPISRPGGGPPIRRFLKFCAAN
jgi:hypothetical protein